MSFIPIMLHSQNFDITLNEDNDFNIFLSVSLHKDFKTSNISRLEMLTAYVSKVYELYLIEQEVDEILKSFNRV